VLKGEVDVPQHFPSNFSLDFDSVKQTTWLRLGTQLVESNLTQQTLFLVAKLREADNVFASEFLLFV
jgi:hypothetical protein